MSQTEFNPYFSDIPCGSNWDKDCGLGGKIADLQSNLVPVPAGASRNLIRAFLKSYQTLLCKSTVPGEPQYPASLTLAALFDLVVSAKYAARMVSDGGWIYCSGNELKERPAFYFPFLKTCPRCSTKRGARPSVKSNKPGSDTIGEISGDTTLQILKEIIQVISPDTKVGKNSARQGDVDFVVYDSEILVLGEIKSSPLVVYPLEISLASKLTEVREGVSVPKRDHTPATANITADDISLYLPHKDVRVNLGPRQGDDWPFPKLIEYVSDPASVAQIVTAWRELYDVYAMAPDRRRTEIDNRRWLTYGCGGKVDDSKNAPGMDRTDDIKKATYQVLKYGTYYKEKCMPRVIRSVVASNFFPLRKFDRYLSEMQDVLWTKDKYSVTLEGRAGQDDIRAFRADSVFNLYDAVICLTRSIYRDEHLKEITCLENFVEKLCV